MKGETARDEQLESAITLHRAGRLAEAAEGYRALLAKDPTHADAAHLLGGILDARGMFGEAEVLIRAAIRQQPKIALFHANLALVLIHRGKKAAALAAADRALKLDSRSVEGLNHRGIALFHLGRYQEAAEAFSAVLQRLPRHLAARNNLGNALRHSGRVDEAEKCYRKVLALSPQYGEAVQNLATLLLHQGRAAEAEASLAAFKGEENPEIQNLKGQICQLQGKTTQARVHFHKAIERKPGISLWELRKHSVCPIIPPSRLAIERWRRTFAEGLNDFQPLDLEAVADELPYSHAEPPYHLAYQGQANLALKSAYAALFKGPPAPAPKPRENSLRIGFLVTGGHERIFLTCTQGIIQRWGSSKAELTLIAPPSSLALLQSRVSNPRVRYMALNGSFTDMVDQVRKAGFHLIYFWEVGSDATNYFLPFFRLAPVQCTSWGTADTSGHPDIDYFLSSKQWEDHSAGDSYSENLLLLERLPTYFLWPDMEGIAPDRKKFGLARDDHAYACVQNLFKVHPDCDNLFLEILKRDQKAKILMVQGKQPNWTALLKNRFGKTMGDFSRRILFLPRLNYREYLTLLASVEVMLDTLHFSGGNTSYEALGMGTPVLTLPGDQIRGRFTLGCYRQIQVMEAVAASSEAYVDKAISLASDPTAKENLSRRIREAHSLLFEDDLAALAFEEALVSLAEQGPKG